MTQSQTEESEPEVHFLSRADVTETFERMLSEFARETDRGSILIAADIVSNELAISIQRLGAARLPKKRLDSLLSYPGFLSTFSARCDAAVLSGFVSQTAYEATNTLRTLRNRAAHSQETFELTPCP